MFNRRLMMAQKKAGPPPGGGIVTDGLVLWLDGADRGGIPGVWIDKAKGRRFNIVDGKDLPTGVHIPYGSNKIIAETPEVFSPIGATIEFCRSSIDTARAVRLFSNNFDQPSFNAEKFGSVLILTNVAYPWPTYSWSSRSAPYTASFTEKYGFINKEKLSPLGKNYWRISGDGKFSISSPVLKGEEIYSLRIYDRQLTESEILQNQQYDIDTYFGGVIPE